MSSLTVQNIQGSASSSNTINVASGHVLNAPGHVIQTVSSTFTSTTTGTGTTIADTGLTATITPSSTSSKIYVNGFINVGSQAYIVYCWLVRGSTQILKGDAASSRPVVTFAGPAFAAGQEIYNMQPSPFSYLDSPNTTSATTYKIQIRQYGTGAWYVNKTHSDRDNADYEPRGASVITLQEIAQ
tara:strand:+ start:849 stop:1403 length:555 start_codon:yes stop_codon:yes gene_type:complete